MRLCLRFVGSRSHSHPSSTSALEPEAARAHSSTCTVPTEMITGRPFSFSELISDYSYSPGCGFGFIQITVTAAHTTVNLNFSLEIDFYIKNYNFCTRKLILHGNVKKSGFFLELSVGPTSLTNSSSSPPSLRLPLKHPNYCRP